jgi:hypothetical protein
MRATTELNLEDIILKEINQSQKTNILFNCKTTDAGLAAWLKW